MLFKLRYSVVQQQAINVMSLFAIRTKIVVYLVDLKIFVTIKAEQVNQFFLKPIESS